ncbi:hypothetical protein [Enhygromyxa salina]|uniref:hypothetical protein n=1 Tax=Enhygromyxa salina TaxID=215803 RepID=UPI0011B24D56|nr:hypothetical protein [Enhygromyxa salina]
MFVGKDAVYGLEGLDTLTAAPEPKKKATAAKGKPKKPPAPTLELLGLGDVPTTDEAGGIDREARKGLVNPALLSRSEDGSVVVAVERAERGVQPPRCLKVRVGDGELSDLTPSVAAYDPSWLPRYLGVAADGSGVMMTTLTMLMLATAWETADLELDFEDCREIDLAPAEGVRGRHHDLPALPRCDALGEDSQQARRHRAGTRQLGSRSPPAAAAEASARSPWCNASCRLAPEFSSRARSQNAAVPGVLQVLATKPSAKRPSEAARGIAPRAPSWPARTRTRTRGVNDATLTRP